MGGPARSFAAVLALVWALGGCYGAKLVRQPVNAEYASRQADSLRAEHRELLGRIAELERALADAREEQLRSQARTAATLSELQDAVRVLAERLRESRGGETARPGVRAARGGAADSAAADTTDASGRAGVDDATFRAAYLDLTRGDVELAIRGFQNYLVQFPTGAHVAEVHYYLGECYYGADRFLEAVGEYRYVADHFPESRLAPAATLKTGRCYERLSEKRLALAAYRRVVRTWPDSGEARQAADAIAQLEGQ